MSGTDVSVISHLLGHKNQAVWGELGGSILSQYYFLLGIHCESFSCSSVLFIFQLFPRVRVVVGKNETDYRNSLGRKNKLFLTCSFQRYDLLGFCFCFLLDLALGF